MSSPYSARATTRRVDPRLELAGPLRWRDVVRILLLLSALPIVGMMGFRWIEGWPLFDALYMSVITLSTVGYLEVHPLSTAGRTFVMAYLVVGLGVFFFSVVRLGEWIVRVELRDWLERRRMDTAIKSMSGHFIVCGCGRMGLALCRRLAATHCSFVVIDRDEDALAEGRRAGWPSVVGDATDDRILESVGIGRARGLAAVLSSDADNLYVVMSARLLAEKLFIIARAVDDLSIPKLQKAGANRVVSLFHTSAVKMAQLLENPGLEDVFEVVGDVGPELELAEIHISPDDPNVGRRLDQTDLRKRGVFIAGIRRPNGELLLPPSGSSLIEADDCLIAFGRPEAIAGTIRRMSALAHRTTGP